MLSFIRLLTCSVALMTVLISFMFVPQNNGLFKDIFTNDLYAKSSALIKSPYKKRFRPSKRIRSKKSRRRSSSSGASGGCIQWDKSKINEKAYKYKVFIDQSSRKYRIDKNLIMAVITAESCFRVTARSHKGAQGLMQLIPATAARFGVKDSYKAQQNIRGGTKYLRFLMDRFRGDLKKVIASYNAGEGAVDKYKGIPPYKETIQYVKNVMKVYSTLKPPVSKNLKKAAYKPTALGNKAGRQGWQYNRSLAPHLYKQK